MSKKPKTRTFFVQSKIDLFTTVEVTATCLEEALQVARELKTTDYVEIIGEHIDSEVEVTGVYE